MTARWNAPQVQNTTFTYGDPTHAGFVMRQTHQLYVPDEARRKAQCNIYSSTPLPEISHRNKFKRVEDIVSTRISRDQPQRVRIAQTCIEQRQYIRQKGNPETFAYDSALNTSARLQNGKIVRDKETYGFDRGMFSVEDRAFQKQRQLQKIQSRRSNEARVLKTYQDDAEKQRKVHQANLAHTRKQQERYEAAMQQSEIEAENM